MPLEKIVKEVGSSFQYRMIFSPFGLNPFVAELIRDNSSFLYLCLDFLNGSFAQMDFLKGRWLFLCFLQDSRNSHFLRGVMGFI